MDPVATARTLAAAHPYARLPCPICAASLKATNLEHHLAKTHPITPPHATVLRGADRRSAVIAGIAMLLAGGAAVAVVTLQAADPFAISLGALAAVFAVLALLGVAGLLPATLEVAGDRLVLRYCLGLRRRSVQLPSAITTGALWGSRPDAIHAGHDHNTPSVPVHLGSYARFADALTIGCKHDLQLAGHWAQCTKGPRRRSCDITVPRATLVALEYALAATGALLPR